MSKEWKAPDKVTQKMTRDGAVAENLTTGETSSISERPQEENYSAPAGAAAEKVVQHIGAEIERHAAKGAEKKALSLIHISRATSHGIPIRSFGLQPGARWFTATCCPFPHYGGFP